jgi:hypothetical protein
MTEEFTYQDFERQQQEIEDETKNSPLVSDRIPITALSQVYNPNNENVQKKIKVGYNCCF